MNRRLPWLKTGIVQRLDLQPGDKLILTFQRRLTAEDVDRVMAIVRQRWHIDTAVNPVGILDDGAQATVVRGGDQP
jgi:hypothetical protein